MGILPLKKRVNRDKCSFATKQRMFGVFAINEILRYWGTRFPGSRTLCHPEPDKEYLKDQNRCDKSQQLLHAFVSLPVLGFKAEIKMEKFTGLQSPENDHHLHHWWQCIGWLVFGGMSSQGFIMAGQIVGLVREIIHRRHGDLGSGPACLPSA